MGKINDDEFLRKYGPKPPQSKQEKASEISEDFCHWLQQDDVFDYLVEELNSGRI